MISTNIFINVKITKVFALFMLGSNQNFIYSKIASISMYISKQKKKAIVEKIDLLFQAT